MQKVFLILFSALIFQAGQAWSQEPAYAVIIKGGHVMDPKNNINEVMDVAISKAGKIAAVAKNINPGSATRVVNAKGLYVVPGIIDMHTHNFAGTEPDKYLRNSYYANQPDGFTFRTGVTTVVDAGSAGWRTFEKFKDQTIDRARTRVLAFLNIVGEGMTGGAPEQNNADMDARLSADMALKYKDQIVGFKVAHYNRPDWVPIDRAIEAGKMAGNIPVIVDFGGGGLSLEELTMKKFRSGDIYTHTYGGGGEGREAITDEVSGKLRPFVFEARQRGVIWDVGHGAASFAFRHAIPAAKEGFFPDVISTDHHGGSMNSAMKDILNVMNKFLTLGMEVPAIINSVTWKPAQVIHREQLGNLSVGSEGDVTVLRIRKGKFGVFDQMGQKLEGKRRFECEVTIKGGRVFYDLNGLTNPIPRVAGGLPSL
ncbi:MAG: amidohydrolase/deacetylase family metallohydrolase [Pedobacter sp.]|jgi:dihydroorotase